MNTQRLQPRPDSSLDRAPTTSDRTARTAPPADLARTPTDRAPKTFAQNARRLENLVDEFNAAFAARRDDRDAQ